jgi:sugar lactone lactonase YvrE
MILAMASCHVSSHLQQRGRLAALCLVLAVMACGAWNDSVAQTAHFGAAQLIVPTSNLNQSVGVAVDGSGNVYVNDSDNFRVLKETPSVGGYTESVIAYTSGQTDGIAVDANGNVYFGDSGSGQLLKQTPSGMQSVVPTSPIRAITGLAVDLSGDVYVVDTLGSRVLKETLSGGSYTESTIGSGLQYPKGVAVDGSGNVYIADTGNNRVLKETFSGGSYIQSSVASTGLGYPWGVAVDGAGNVYFPDPGYSRLVEEIPSGSTYIQRTVPTSALNNPLSIAVDNSGNVYVDQTVTSNGNQSVLKVFTAVIDFKLINVGSSASAISLTFSFDSTGSIGVPLVVTQGAANLDFTDVGTGTCTTNGVSHEYNSGDTCTVNVVLTPKNAGARYGAVELVNSTGNVVAMAYMQGNGVGPQVSFPPGVLSQLSLPNVTDPTSIAVDEAGNLYIAEAIVAYDPANSVVKETWNGSGYTQSTVATGLGYPTGVAIDGAGNIYIADQDGFTVFKETPTANGSYAQSIVDDTLGTVGGLGVDGAGNVYVGRGGIGIEKETLSGGSYTRSEIFYTFYGQGMAVDGAGNLYFPSSGGILKESPSANGYVQSTVGSIDVSSVAVDGLGNVYGVIGFSNGSVWKEEPSGNSYVQTELASGLNDARGLAVDGVGNVYFSTFLTTNTYNFWEISASLPPVLHFAATDVGQTSTDSPQTVTVENVGNAPLVFPIPSTGNNPSIATNFTVNSGGASACPQLSPNSSTAGTLIAGASCTLSISFTPQTAGTLSGSLVLTDNNLNAAAPGYTTQSSSLSGNGLQATPTITWATPAAITYGTALSGSQLNATSTVAGTFTYSPAAGTVLGAGQQRLTVTFTPTDSTDYTTATGSVTLTVNQVAPAITWATPAAITYGTALSATQLDATASVPGTFVYTPAAGTVPAIGNDTLSSVFTPTDSTDYSTATSSVSLTVNPGAPVLSGISPGYVSAGGAAFPLTATGSGFIAGSTVYWGTTALATTYGSATQLTAQVTAADIASAGITLITVQTPAPGGGTSSALQFEVDSAGAGSTAPTFTTVTATVTAGSPASYPVTLPSSVESATVNCLNLPTGVTCSYSATTNTLTITTSSTTPKGTYQITVVFTETVSGAAASWILLPILLLPLVFLRRKLAARGVWVTASLGLVLLAGAAVACAGCGGGGSSTPPPPQTHQAVSSGAVSITVQ